ncbi:MAG TPA: hypothetical protein VK484_12015 [Ferruginibacter sp.]|nr:hypothetical protein [Ferruginibacter sp.]
MNIGLDMMGGDFAPLEAVKGAAEFLSIVTTDVHLTLIGDKEKIKNILPATLFLPINTASFMQRR